MKLASRAPAAALAVGLAAGLAACGGTTGTLAVDLVTAPDSHVLDAVQRLRLTLTEPHQVVEVVRGAAGFDVALELDATSAAGALIVEGFDAGGALVACGRSPELPLGGINASIAVYVAAPRSIALAPAALSGALSGVAGVAVSFGAVLAGGAGEPGAAAATTAIAAYSAFDHTLSPGVPLPAPRAGLAIGATTASSVYLFGGSDAAGAPTGTLWRFDATAAPMGSMNPISDQASFARAGQGLVPIASDHYLVTGAPPLDLQIGTVTARTDVASLPAAGTEVVPGDGNPTAIFAGPGLLRYRGGQFDALGGDAGANLGPGAATVLLPDGRIGVFGGSPGPDALVVDAATGAVTAVAGALSVARQFPAAAATSRYVVVAGGSDAAGAPIATADVLDAATLARVATLPIRGQIGGFALALPDDQVLIGGGAPAAAALELFTPEPPP